MYFRINYCPESSPLSIMERGRGEVVRWRGEGTGDRERLSAPVTTFETFGGSKNPEGSKR
jgi:hypothetical protein